MKRTAKRKASRPKAKAAKAKPARRVAKASATPSANDPAAVRRYIAKLQAPLRAIAARFDALVARAVPGVARAIKWSMPFYGVPGRGWFVSCGGFTNHVRLTFFQGTKLKPVPPDGSHAQLRGAVLRTLADFDAKKITSWVKQAAKLPGFGK